MLTVKEYKEIKKLGELLGHQGCVKIPKNVWSYAKTVSDKFKLICDIYNYGYIMGQRAERARRKGAAHHD